MRSKVPKKMVRVDQSLLVAGCEISHFADNATVHGDVTKISVNFRRNKFVCHL